MSDKKTAGQELSEKLSNSRINAWEKADKVTKEFAFSFCEEYKGFLNKGKTERECVIETQKQAEKNGFIPLEKAKKLKAGDKIYSVIKNKAIILAIIGKEPLENGINLVAAHVDSPRLDLRPKPMYQHEGMVLLKTHYYGGIKKYQWVTIPLAMHGIVVKADGTKVDVTIGEDEDDTVLTITDLLPHLAQSQLQKKLSDGIEGEDLNVLLGSIPYDDNKVKDKVKLAILDILHQKYGIIEQDFASAELEIVPAFKARDVGLDRSFVGGYGQDDRACAYTGLKAIFDMQKPSKTAVCMLLDREEIGSMGNTGAKSNIIRNFVLGLLTAGGETPTGILPVIIKDCFENSRALSADVNAGVDPTFDSVFEKSVASFVNEGVVIEKYGGARGKSGTNDTSAEFVGQVRKLFNDNGIIWQIAELGGKIDAGGGGTIAQFIANLGIETLDCGPSVLSMHAPFELISKIDILHTYKAYKAFLEWQ